MRDFIHQIKYQKHPSLGIFAGEQLGYTLLDFIRNFEIIVPVPLHKNRLKWRGFNQSDRLAKGIQKAHANFKILNALARFRETETQTLLTKEKRIENVRGAFRLRGALPIAKYKNFLLIDDIGTTGATLTACAEILLEAGANHVGAITFASV